MIANVMSPFDMVLAREGERSKASSSQRNRRRLHGGNIACRRRQGVRLGEGTTSWRWTNRVPLAKRKLGTKARDKRSSYFEQLAEENELRNATSLVP
ncbi:hypothetical protein GQ607_001918 [Colletotrichum asianum]|uniref:Uncharacterized protein n=1 Tax=Colletotrichum asianum TaxID=702518 RepID=A0A8H3WN43_9PEZI|nr:hypothetical protein GQ607_001918 [Colletotrichum asianum]